MQKFTLLSKIQLTLKLFKKFASQIFWLSLIKEIKLNQREYITMLKHYTIPIFVPEMACPHQCVFCDQRKISGQIEIPTIEDVKKKMDEVEDEVAPPK